MQPTRKSGARLIRQSLGGTNGSTIRKDFHRVRGLDGDELTARHATYLVTASDLLYSSAVPRLHRPLLSDFFIIVRLLKERAKLVDADFHLLALAFNRRRVMHPVDLTAWLTAWVFLPDPAARRGMPLARRCIRSRSRW